MKFSWIVAILIAAVGAYFYFFPRISPSQVLVDRSFMDSLTAVSNRPPEVKWDTVRVPHDSLIFVPHLVPVPYEVKGDTSFYKDTTDTQDVTIFLQDTIQGKLLGRGVSYKLKVPREITKTVTRFVPVPMQPNKDPTWTHYGSLGVGYGYSLELGAIYRNKFIFGAEALSTKGSPALLLKIGIKF